MQKMHSAVTWDIKRRNMSEICQLEIPCPWQYTKRTSIKWIFCFWWCLSEMSFLFCLFYIWIAYLIGWVDLHISEPHERVWKRSWNFPKVCHLRSPILTRIENVNSWVEFSGISTLIIEIKSLVKAPKRNEAMASDNEV